MRKPLSVYSNIAYGAAGLAVTASGGAINVYVGAALALLMVGSTAYHSDRVRLGQAFDEMAMYAVFVALLVHMVSHVFIFAAWKGILMGSVVTVALASAYKKLDSFMIIPVLCLAALAILGALVGWITALYLLALFLISVVIRAIGQRRDSDALHALWHLVTAWGIYLTWSVV